MWASLYLVIALPTDHIERSEGGDDIAQHAAFDKLRKTASDLKTRRSNSDSIGCAASIGDEVVAELAVAGLGIRIDFTLGHLGALHNQLEVLDGRFDGGVDTVLFRQHEARIVAADGTVVGHPLERLVDDSLGLSNLAEANEKAIERVPFRPHRDVEVDFVVLEIRVSLADVVGDAGRSQARPGPSERGRIGAADATHVLETIDEDAVLEQHLLAFLDEPQNLRQGRPAEALEIGGGWVGHAPDAAKRMGESRAGFLFENVPNHLAGLDEPEKRRERPELHGHRPVAGQMVAQPRELAQNHPIPLAALGDGQAAKLLDRERIADVVEHRRDVVEAIDVGEDLRPGPALA